MYMAMNRGLVFAGIVSALTFAASLPARAAESAYISQVSGTTGSTVPTATAQPTQIGASGNYAQRQAAFVPTPETTRHTPTSTNFANTVQVGSYNNVGLVQSGGNNYANIGAIGSDNNVVVQQKGNDFSNVAVINGQSNTPGLSVAVIQPPGSTPVNMLIAKLPNGSILIKR